MHYEDRPEELKAKLNGCMREFRDIEQILGKALGYAKCDTTVCSESTDDVCVGDHTACTLAMEMAKIYSSIKQALKKTQKELSDIRAARSCSNCVYELFHVDAIPCSLCNEEYSKWELGSGRKK